MTFVKGEAGTSPLTSCRLGLTLQYTGDEAHGPGRIKYTDTCGSHLVDDSSILIKTHVGVTHSTRKGISHILMLRIHRFHVSSSAFTEVQTISSLTLESHSLE